jgi:hypothetical protein
VATYLDGDMKNPPSFEQWIRDCEELTRWRHGDDYWWAVSAKDPVVLIAEFIGANEVKVYHKGKTARYRGRDVNSLRRAGTAAGNP